MYHNRYIYDVLYGRIQFPEFVWKALLCPEIQRLREVRLCNINSLCLTGGANINRFEHSLGAAYLALTCVEQHEGKLNQKTKERIVLAALLHDVGTTAFGHSVQYVLDPRGYQHDCLYDIAQAGGDKETGKYTYQHTRMEPIYFGMPKRLATLISDEDLKAISEMVEGRGQFGPLISGSIDLDNMDNVYRLAYHIGIVNSKNVPLDLASSIWVEDGQIVVNESATSLLEEWYETRRLLYHYLLLNPDEFSAKCMLEEALLLAQSRSSTFFNWHDVDYQLLEKLAKCSFEVTSIVSRLMIGDLYGCIGIYSTHRIDAYDLIEDPKKRHALEKDIEDQIRKLKYSNLKSAIIAIHAIKDVNKTERQINVRTDKGSTIKLGNSSHRVLIGIFFKNVHLSMLTIKEDALEGTGIRRVVRKRLGILLKDPGIKEIKPYNEFINTK